jgi:hypothetical protein
VLNWGAAKSQSVPPALATMDEYLPVNKKIIFMKWDGDDFNPHGIFVDDLASILTFEKLKLEFEELYSADFDLQAREGRSWNLFWYLKLGSWRMGSSFTLICMLRSSSKSTASTIASSSSRKKHLSNLSSFFS